MDDPEFEVSDLRSPPDSSTSSSSPGSSTPASPPAQRQSPFPGALLSWRWRLALGAASVLLALVVIASVLAPLHNHASGFTGYPSPIAPPTATRVLEPTPLPMSKLLAPPPTNCPSSPALNTITVPAFGGFVGSTVQLSGAAPVWVPEGYLPQGSYAIPQTTPEPTTAPIWPNIFMIWAIGPNAHPTVTVRAYDLQTGEAAWWAEGGNSPQMPVLTMNPSVDEPAAVGWITYQTLLFIPHAGCYKMDVSWQGGGWSAIFAAGGGEYPG